MSLNRHLQGEPIFFEVPLFGLRKAKISSPLVVSGFCDWLLMLGLNFGLASHDRYPEVMLTSLVGL